jgi:hypothetical protein
MLKGSLTVKVVTLILLAVLMAGCSAARKSRSRLPVDGDAAAGWYTYSDLYNSNVSNDGFFIRKIRLELLTEGQSNRFTATLRKDSEGRWLASIRSFAGIEVIRAFADKDKVVLLDRLGRNALTLSWMEMTNQFGLTYDLLPILVGDVPQGAVRDRKRVSCGESFFLNPQGLDITLSPDCNVMRLETMIAKEGNFGREISVFAGDYKEIDGRAYSSFIQVREKEELFHVKIFIDDIEIPWSGEIEFSIPSNYKTNR